jgi:hypothetical protein
VSQRPCEGGRVALRRLLLQLIETALRNASDSPYLRMRDGRVLMRFVCDTGENTWFEIETEGEAALESELMAHAVQKHFCQAYAAARASYVPSVGPFVEQEIGLKDHIRRAMPRFFTLRDPEGNGLTTAMLRLSCAADSRTPAIIELDPEMLPKLSNCTALFRVRIGIAGAHDRARCYPYSRQ